VVQSYVKNPSQESARQVDFELVLPEKAFISNFTIETGGKTYVSKVERKEEAKKTYEEALSSGLSAGLVDARQGNVFGVNANVAAADKILFTLTYEQLLERRLSKYEHVLHLNPKQIVDDLSVDVYINESLPIKDLNVPKLKEMSNEITSELAKNPIAVIDGEDSNQVHIQYKPSPNYQRDLSDEKGLNGQFIVQYDVDRGNQSSEVQVYDGYMVHFFAPENLKVLPKHVVFVLDVSGSMGGDKLDQLKNAMVTILGDLAPQDHFSIMTFSYEVKHWVPKGEREEEDAAAAGQKTAIYPAAKSYFVDEAMDYVLALDANGGTNINDALIEAVEIVREGQTILGKEVVPAVIFLTDGQATSGTSNPDTIRSNLKESNSDVKVPIYGLAFGSGADYNLLRDISADNRAFARKIFADSDSSIQLEDFYMEISSPLLSNVTFEYVGDYFKEPTENIVPKTCYHSGSEIISVVKLDLLQDQDDDGDYIDSLPPPELIVNGESRDGGYQKKIQIPWRCEPHPRPVDWQQSNHTLPEFPDFIRPPFLPCVAAPPAQRPVNFIERLWAFLTLENLLDDKKSFKKTGSQEDDTLSDEERKEKAIELALKYNFVSDVTSLVVVKPKKASDDVTNPEDPVTSNSTTSNNLESAAVAVLTPVGQAAVRSSYQSYQPTFYNSVALSYSAPAPPPPPGPAGMRIVGGLGGPVLRSGGPPRRTMMRVAGGGGNFPGNQPQPQSGSPILRNSGMFLMHMSNVPPMSMSNRRTNRPPQYQPQMISKQRPRPTSAYTTTTYRPPPTTTMATYDYYSDDNSSEIEMLQVEEATTTEKTCDVSQCKLELFTKTLLRGEKVVLTGDVGDLDGLGFDDKVISLRVNGTCRWELFRDTDYQGASQSFVASGTYKNAVSLSKVFRKASSAKIAGCV